MGDVNLVQLIFGLLMTLTSGMLLINFKMTVDNRDRIVRLESDESVPAWLTTILKELKTDIKELSKSMHELIGGLK